MSILTRPQGSPERVLSLLGGLAALGGQASRQELEGLLNPGFLKNGAESLSHPAFVSDTVGAATSLGLLSADRREARLEPSLAVTGALDLADAIHDRLRSLEDGDSDNVVLDTYAWVVVESDRQGGLGWLFDFRGAEFADRANEALVGEDEDGKLMNPTKAVAWRRWIVFLGLAVPLGDNQQYPMPSSRIARELRRGEFPTGGDVSAEEFLARVAQRQPYLDRGRLFQQAGERIGHSPKPRQLSPLLSDALRDLHDEGQLVLKLSGDSQGAVTLSPDPTHPLKSFDAVVYQPRESLT
jgi:hypothetical protein